jgi:hypothetical protein
MAATALLALAYLAQQAGRDWLDDLSHVIRVPEEEPETATTIRYFVAVRVQYHDNFFAVESGREGDVGIISLARADLVAANPTGSHSLHLLSNYNAYLDHPGANSDEHRLLGKSEWHWTRGFLEISDLFRYESEPLDPQLVRRAARISNDATARGGLGLSGRFGVEASAHASVLDFLKRGPDDSDNTQFGGTLAAVYAPTETLDLLVDAGYEKIDYVRRPDSDARSVQAGCRYTWSERTSMSAFAGYSEVETRSRKESNLVFQAGLTWEMSERNGLWVEASRSARFSVLGDFQFLTRAQAAWRHGLSSRLVLLASATYELSETPRIGDRSRFLGRSELIWEASDLLQFGFGYLHRRGVAGEPSAVYSENIVFIQAGLSGP